MKANELSRQKQKGFLELKKLLKGIHNASVTEAYSGGDTEGQTTLLRLLKVQEHDGFNELVLKIIGFKLVCDRIIAVSSAPQYFPVKSEKFKPQAVIMYAPVKRRKHGFKKYDNNTYLTIPHMDTAKLTNAKLPPYTVGTHTAKYTLADSSYILCNAQTEEESIQVVEKLAEFTKVDKRSSGAITDHITTTKRSGKKKLALDGQAIVPKRLDYYPNTKTSGITPTEVIHL